MELYGPVGTSRRPPGLFTLERHAQLEACSFALALCLLVTDYKVTAHKVFGEVGDCGTCDGPVLSDY